MQQLHLSQHSQAAQISALHYTPENGREFLKEKKRHLNGEKVNPASTQSKSPLQQQYHHSQSTKVSPTRLSIAPYAKCGHHQPSFSSIYRANIPGHDQHSQFSLRIPNKVLQEQKNYSVDFREQEGDASARQSQSFINLIYPSKTKKIINNENLQVEDSQSKENVTHLNSKSVIIHEQSIPAFTKNKSGSQQCSDQKKGAVFNYSQRLKQLLQESGDDKQPTSKAIASKNHHIFSQQPSPLQKKQSLLVNSSMDLQNNLAGASGYQKSAQKKGGNQIKSTFDQVIHHDSQYLTLLDQNANLPQTICYTQDQQVRVKAFKPHTQQNTPQGKNNYAHYQQNLKVQNQPLQNNFVSEFKDSFINPPPPASSDKQLPDEKLQRKKHQPSQSKQLQGGNNNNSKAALPAAHHKRSFSDYAVVDYSQQPLKKFLNAGESRGTVAEDRYFSPSHKSGEVESVLVQESKRTIQQNYKKVQELQKIIAQTSRSSQIQTKSQTRSLAKGSTDSSTNMPPRKCSAQYQGVIVGKRSPHKSSFVVMKESMNRHARKDSSKGSIHQQSFYGQNPQLNQSTSKQAVAPSSQQQQQQQQYLQNNQRMLIQKVVKSAKVSPRRQNQAVQKKPQQKQHSKKKSIVNVSIDLFKGSFQQKPATISQGQCWQSSNNFGCPVSFAKQASNSTTLGSQTNNSCSTSTFSVSYAGGGCGGRAGPVKSAFNSRKNSMANQSSKVSSSRKEEQQKAMVQYKHTANSFVQICPSTSLLKQRESYIPSQNLSSLQGSPRQHFHPPTSVSPSSVLYAQEKAARKYAKKAQKQREQQPSVVQEEGKVPLKPNLEKLLHECRRDENYISETERLLLQIRSNIGKQKPSQVSSPYENFLSGKQELLGKDLCKITEASMEQAQMETHNEGFFESKARQTHDNYESQQYLSTDPNLSPYSKDVFKLKKVIKFNFKKFDEAPLTTSEFYRIGRILGRGAFGKVNLAAHKLSEQLVAIKSINKEFLKSQEDQKKKIMQEVGILKQCNHPSVVRLFDQFETQKHMCFVMELCCGGDLLTYVRKRRKLKEDVAKHFFKQLIEGLAYLHNSKLIAHRDIKLDNILLDQNGKIKIGDFGVSKQVSSETEVMAEQCGTPAYIAPEILRDHGYQGFKVDVWSAGVCLYAMLVGTVPFKAQSMSELHHMILAGRFELKEQEGVSDPAKDLIGKLLQVDEKKRLSAWEVLGHPWLKDAESDMDVFTQKEKDLINREYLQRNVERNFQSTQQRNQETEVLFTEHNLDTKSSGSLLLKNASTKSIILAPFNSTISSSSSQSGWPSHVQVLPKRVIKFGAKCRDLDRQYEQNNNADLDNGVYNEFINEQEREEEELAQRKQLQAAGSEDSIQKSFKDTELSSDDEKAEQQIEKKHEEQNCMQSELREFENQIKQQYVKYEEPVLNIDYSIVEEIVREGIYPRSYLLQSIKAKEINYASANYYLVLKKRQLVERLAGEAEI